MRDDDKTAFLGALCPDELEGEGDSQYAWVQRLGRGRTRPNLQPFNQGRSEITDEEKTGHQDAAEGAAEDATDQDRLLPGEDAGTSQLDDAQHWLQVYTELLSFKGDLLRSTHEHLADMDLEDDSREEVRQTDEPVLEAEAERFERRRRFWEQRAEELSRG
jgi:hypothetical protein